MIWRILALTGLIAISTPAGAEKRPIGTITFGGDAFEIVHVAAYENRMMNAIDLELFNKALPAGETYFSLDSDATAVLRGMRLRIGRDPEYRNGTWMHPTIQDHDQFYYFGEDDPIILTIEIKGDRVKGSIAGEDQVGATRVKVNLTFDVPVAADD